MAEVRQETKTVGQLSRIEPSIGMQLSVAAVFALVAFAICWRGQYGAHALGGDHLMIWRAAHIVLDGGDPCKLVWSIELPALHTAFNYPLPAVGMGVPFVWLRQQDAAIAFATCSGALLGFVLTKSSQRATNVLAKQHRGSSRSLYLPCLVMILRRPNDGESPELVSRIVERFR